MARGVDGRDIFLDDADRQLFLQSLLRIRGDTGFSILAYCLMGNHFHLAIKVGQTPLSQIVHRLLTAYVMAFNSKHGRTGHLFQARYKAILCLDDSYLLGLVRYIHENPVRASLVGHASMWPWSSFRDYSTKTPAPIVDTRMICEILHAYGQGYCDWHTSDNGEFRPWPEVENGHGSILFREELVPPVALNDLAKALFRDPEVLVQIRNKSRLKPAVESRRRFARHATANGHSLASIATWLGCTTSAVHYLVRRTN